MPPSSSCPSLTGTELLRNDVAKIDSQNFSIMPEGLIQVFSDQELIDLISYLEGNEQVPLP